MSATLVITNDGSIQIARLPDRATAERAAAHYARAHWEEDGAQEMGHEGLSDTEATAQFFEVYPAREDFFIVDDDESFADEFCFVTPDYRAGISDAQSKGA